VHIILDLAQYLVWFAAVLSGNNILAQFFFFFMFMVYRTATGSNMDGVVVSLFSSFFDAPL